MSRLPQKPAPGLTCGRNARPPSDDFKTLLEGPAPRPAPQGPAPAAPPEERRRRAAEERTDAEPAGWIAPLELRGSGAREAPPVLAPRAPDLDAMAQRLLAGLAVIADQGGSAVRLELRTARLSLVRVELRLARGALSARFEAGSAAAARELQGLLPALELALQRRGLRVGAFDVATARRGALPAARAPQAASSRRGKRDRS